MAVLHAASEQRTACGLSQTTLFPIPSVPPEQFLAWARKRPHMACQRCCTHLRIEHQTSEPMPKKSERVRRVHYQVKPEVEAWPICWRRESYGTRCATSHLDDVTCLDCVAIIDELRKRMGEQASPEGEER